MTIIPDNLDHVPSARAAARVCPGCGHVGLTPERISCSVWHGGGLVVIRGIPALVCPACNGEHIDPSTARQLNRMRKGRFRDRTAVATVEVPIYQFAGEATPKEARPSPKPGARPRPHVLSTE